MTSFATVVKSEIVRVSRREIKPMVEPLRKANLQQRREIAALKRQLQVLEQYVKRMSRGVGPAKAKAVEVTEDIGPALRFSAKGLRSLRERHDLSAQDVGQLIGVSSQTIYNWEQKKTGPKSAQLKLISELRQLSHKEILERLSKGESAEAPAEE
jgi:DNA-binding transcriptional regulator YiaG